MPKPTTFEWAAGTTSGGVAVFTRQPAYFEWDYAPIVTRGDGGGVQDGLNAIVLCWRTMKPAEWDQLTDMYNDAVGQAGIFFLKYWDEFSNGGAGAYVTEECRVRERPTADRSPSSPNYINVKMKFSSLGIA